MSLKHALDLLQYIPLEPREAVSTSRLLDLFNQNKTREEQRDIRTIQRALSDLKDALPQQLKTHRTGRESFWSIKNGHRLVFPPLGHGENLGLLASTSNSYISGESIKNFITSLEHKALNKKIAFRSRTIDRIPPEKKSMKNYEKNMEAIGRALSEETRVRAIYKKLHEKEPKTYDLEPIGLLVQGNTNFPYLIAHDINDPKVKQFSINRFLDVLNLNQKIRTKERLSQYLEKNEDKIRMTGQPNSIELRFKIRTNEGSYQIEEMTISKDQKLLKRDNEWTEFSAKMPNTQQLRTWIRSYGYRLVVLKPKFLRDELRCEVKQLTSSYE